MTLDGQTKVLLGIVLAVVALGGLLPCQRPASTVSGDTAAPPEPPGHPQERCASCHPDQGDPR